MCAAGASDCGGEAEGRARAADGLSLLTWVQRYIQSALDLCQGRLDPSCRRIRISDRFLGLKPGKEQTRATPIQNMRPCISHQSTGQAGRAVHTAGGQTSRSGKTAANELWHAGHISVRQDTKGSRSGSRWAPCRLSGWLARPQHNGSDPPHPTALFALGTQDSGLRQQLPWRH